MSDPRTGLGRSLGFAGGIVLVSLALTSCAAPPVTLYTLGQSALTRGEAPLGRKATVIEVVRVTIPDYLDTQDIVVRRGSMLESSHNGRWASRLSLGATELLTAHLAQSRPDALVTDQPQIATPSYRILINVSQLDVTVEGGSAQGRATLEADWLIVPRDPAVPTLRARARLSAGGPVGTNREIVALEKDILSQLADSIDISHLR